jgi:hypothetical protein
MISKSYRESNNQLFVVQLIYAADPNHLLVREKKVLVGQMVDVFIDTRPTGRPQGYVPGGEPWAMNTARLLHYLPIGMIV